MFLPETTRKTMTQTCCEVMLFLTNTNTTCIKHDKLKQNRISSLFTDSTSTNTNFYLNKQVLTKTDEEILGRFEYRTKRI